jgi:hypothetical protein
MPSYSIREAQELQRLYGFRIERTMQTFDAHKAAIIGKDPSWPVDFAVMRSRYELAKQQLALLPTDEATGYKTDPFYGSKITNARNALARAVQQTPMARTKGDLSDLMGRLSSLGFPVDTSGEPLADQEAAPEDVFMRQTAHVPTPGQVFGGAGLLLLLYVAWETGLLDGILTRRIRVR